jgi:hypothetical protein
VAQPTSQRLMLEAIKGLPPATRREIVDLIDFVRQRTRQSHACAEERDQGLLHAAWRHLSHDEAVHLAEECKDYDRRDPLG